MNREKKIRKTVVITGATSGIGLAAAMELARKGAFIIGAGRSRERCQKSEKMIRDESPGARIVFHPADLSSLSRVRELAARIKEVVKQEDDGTVDVLINNAATFSSWFVLTPEGFELQFAVNHLAPFLLTHELFPLLKKAPEGRVITVSSGSHYRTKINWTDIMLRKRYNCLKAYKQSKLANVLFTAEFNRRLGPDSTVRAYAADPGLVNTEIGLKGTAGLARWVWSIRRHSGRTPAEGAATIVYLACETLAQDQSAIYWRDCRPCLPSRYGLRKDAAAKLWELSEKMCGISSEDYGLGYNAGTSENNGNELDYRRKVY